jgi:1,4-dihydroxy-2-naphthoate octaprenyltransferase
VLPYVLGGVIVCRLEGRFHWGVFGFGTLGVVLIMLATYLAGEYWDYDEDKISGAIGRSRFAGGSGVLQAGTVQRRTVLWASIGSVALALVDGLVLVLVYGVGAWALLLGAIGALGGFFYSTRPIRWVSTGWGELWIGFCYGWLPVAIAYYLQADTITPIIHWIAVPIGLTIFNVILLNEFPDHPADMAAGKTNLAVRLGLGRAAYLYALASLASWGGMFLSLAQGVPVATLWVYVPVMALSIAVTVLTLKGRWADRATLEKLCGGTLIVNLGTTLAYIVGYAV